MSDRANIAESSQSYDALFGGSTAGLIEQKVTLVSGQNVVRGTVLGKISTGGKYAKSLSTAEDGSEDPVAIAAEDCNASSADASMMVYTAGIFNEAALTFGDSHTADTTRAALQDLGIYLRKGMA